ncbi:MAG: hypothetical protein ACK47B_01495 [Armatimonadota bacterium]
MFMSVMEVRIVRVGVGERLVAVPMRVRLALARQSWDPSYRFISSIGNPYPDAIRRHADTRPPHY